MKLKIVARIAAPVVEKVRALVTVNKERSAKFVLGRRLIRCTLR